MATTTVNSFIRSGLTGALAVGIDTSVTNPVVTAGNSSLPTSAAAGAIIAGDMIYLTSNHLAASLSTPGSANANAASFIGVSEDTYPLIIGQGVVETYASNAGPARVQYRREGEFRFHTTVADTLVAGQAVYLGADGQTVQATASGTSIGNVSTDQRAVGVALGTSITGAAGQDVIVRIKPAI